MIVTVLLLSVFVTVQAQPVLSVIGEDFALPDFGLRIDEADAMFEEKQEYIDTLLLESEELEMLKEEDLLEDVAEKVASIEAKEAESIAKVEEAEAEYEMMLMDVPGPFPDAEVTLSPSEERFFLSLTDLDPPNVLIASAVMGLQAALD